MKPVILLVFISMLLGCSLSTVSFMRPNGEFGVASIDGCSQIPDAFKYEEDNSTYLVKIFFESLSLSVEVLEKDVVVWRDRNVEISIDGKTTHLQAVDLIKYDYKRESCGGFTDILNCKTFQGYVLAVKIPSVENADRVVVKPPIPMINGKAMQVSEIKFNRVSETLFQAVNC